MQEQPKFVDGLRNFCTSWTGKVMISGGSFFLIRTLTDANLTATSLVVLIVFGILGIFENNPTGWKRAVYIVILIICFLAGGIIWLNKYQPFKPLTPNVTESQKLVVEPRTLIPSAERSPKISIDLRITGTFVRTKDYKKEPKMRLGLIPFKGNDFLLGNKSWIEPEKVIGEENLYEFKISDTQRKFSTQKVTMGFLTIEIDQRVALSVYYTWDLESGQWTAWSRDLPEKQFAKSQSDEVQKFVEEFSGCLQSHFQDRNYTPCY